MSNFRNELLYISDLKTSMLDNLSILENSMDKSWIDIFLRWLKKYWNSIWLDIDTESDTWLVYYYSWDIFLEIRNNLSISDPTLDNFRRVLFLISELSLYNVKRVNINSIQETIYD